MSHDDVVKALATRAGLAADWTDQAGEPQTVAPDTLRRLLEALGLDCGSQAEATAATERLDALDRARAPLVTAIVGQGFSIVGNAGPAKLVREDGESFDLTLADAGSGKVHVRAILEPGYHRLLVGGDETTVAVAPRSGVSIATVAGGRRMWGLAAQVYGLARKGDGGVGDMGGVAALADTAARAGADALALSPLHAGFTADPHHFGPYSPSSRLFLNPLHADPEFIFGEERMQEVANASGFREALSAHEGAALIDWPAASRAKLGVLRALFENFRAVELAAAPASRLASDFAAFRTEGGALLEEHARFETLHGARFNGDPGQWSWRSWPEALRNPASAEVAAFAAGHATEVDFHVFLQWISDRSLAAAQTVARQAGMAIGLISDLAVGMDAGGSHAWSRQEDVLVGLSVGSPPDLFNPNGQAWGLATFSPIALKANGYAAFLATLRACMKNAGGVRIDHAMGLARLWMVPEGENAKHGAYLAFPMEDMMRLVALESVRNGAVVIGEDLGTVPAGFRERLAEAGVAGMRVLQFEKNDDRFFPPEWYPADALAMTTTHDLPTMAGWWSGADIDLRASIGGDQFGETAENDREARETERGQLWSAFRTAGAAVGQPPPFDLPEAAVDAAVDYLSATPSKLVLLPLEDAIGQVEQPNLPGTLDEHPNWRRRLPKSAPELLAEPAAAARLESLNRRRQT